MNLHRLWQVTFRGWRTEAVVRSKGTENEPAQAVVGAAGQRQWCVLKGRRMNLHRLWQVTFRGWRTEAVVRSKGTENEPAQAVAGDVQGLEDRGSSAF
uniref:Uncharacterized protein n=1 Tax=Knipowitschia caucasica TaxID=637954 RepID=A0AAV2LLG3_KNICA